MEDGEVLKRFPKIPSMPLSAEVADTILSSLGGVPLPLQWRGTLKSMVRNVGPGPTILNFTYQVRWCKCKYVVSLSTQKPHLCFSVFEKWLLLFFFFFLHSIYLAQPILGKDTTK